ncbi:PorP/SprF family type IX secretion system membrane protein [Marinoscillum furvescens]|nr:PorP/SprF family type IX secretion system membrane protein [Marinoscillum furvescens]
MRKLLLMLALAAVSWEVQAQDIRFTQFYQAPIYLNPAFTGATGMARVGTNYRKQGSANESSFKTHSAYADYYFKDFYASAGVLLLSDQDEFNGFFTRTVALPISYDFSVTKNITVKPALQGSFSQQGIDFSHFLFSDQIDNEGNVSGGSNEPLAVNDQISYYDVAFGVLTFGKQWWFGYGMHNLLQNNVSFVEGGEATLPIRYSVHGGYTIKLDKTRRKSAPVKTMMPTFSYISQGGFSQLDAGVIFQLEPLIFGALYRGIPNPTYDGDYSAISWVVGVSKFDISVGYSYDMPLDNATQPGGIHEISLTFLFDPTDPNATPRSAKRLKCPLPY